MADGEGGGIKGGIRGRGYPKGRRKVEKSTDRLRFLVGTRPSIRFGDKERGLRGLVKLLFDARRARQKVWEAKARSKWAHVKKGN